MQLSDLTGVKPEIIGAMEEAGLTIEEIATGDIDLAVFHGVGKRTAETIIAQAKAMTEDAPQPPEWEPGLQSAAPAAVESVEATVNDEPAGGDLPPMSPRVRRAVESAGR